MFRIVIVLATVSLALAGCDLATKIKPPSPSEILAMPAKSGPTDAKLNFKPHGKSAISLTGKGVLVFRPRLASHVVFTGGFGEERIEIDGKAYTRGSLG